MCSRASAAGSPQSASRSMWTACTSRSPARSAEPEGCSPAGALKDADITAVDHLTRAVPRGSLFEDTVELIARLGLDTDALRSNDRKLPFEYIGVIIMRPSDVPTY